jgi:hypothetical protein
LEEWEAEFLHIYTRARGSVVVKAICYKPEGLCSKADEVNELFSIYLFLPSALGPEFTQPLTEMTIRSRKILFLRSRAWTVHRDGNFTAICEPIV